ncbi:MAG: cupin domain-containing protein [Acidimicrobiales bacterium]|nr:cupin domain-containing protein [Acidimicrobiales bacterium]
MDTRITDTLGLEPHPEGGWFRQTWVSAEEMTTADGRARPSATLIYFLLRAGETSAWHRVASDEIWLAHDGAVTLEYGGDSAEPVSADRIVIGTDAAAGQSPQAIVPAGVWQRTLPGDQDVLVSCVVSPGFDFADFELHR